MVKPGEMISRSRISRGRQLCHSGAGAENHADDRVGLPGPGIARPCPAMTCCGPVHKTRETIGTSPLEEHPIHAPEYVAASATGAQGDGVLGNSSSGCCGACFETLPRCAQDGI